MNWRDEYVLGPGTLVRWFPAREIAKIVQGGWRALHRLPEFADIRDVVTMDESLVPEVVAVLPMRLIDGTATNSDLTAAAFLASCFRPGRWRRTAATRARRFESALVLLIRSETAN